jgi:hypothetical protein
VDIGPARARIGRAAEVGQLAALAAAAVRL